MSESSSDMATSARPTPAQLHASVTTNPTSDFRAFSLKLRNGATLTGLSFVPSSRPLTACGKPLMVGIHGATCSAYNYDVSPEYTASKWCNLFGIPFVAFNRPNYLDSSGWISDRSSNAADGETQFKPTEGLSYFQEEAKWYHEYIFPALWKHFALPNGCTSIVTQSHSMSVPVTIIAASLYSKKEAVDRTYRWAGMTISGFSELATDIRTKNTEQLQSGFYAEPSQLPLGHNPAIHLPSYNQKDKQDLMLGPEGLVDPTLRSLIWRQHTVFHIQEVVDMVAIWPQQKKDFKAGVAIPVLYGLGEYDWVWQGTKEDVELFCREFTKAPRIEGAVVYGAPHAIELSKVSAGWWTRVLGWAMEVAADEAMTAKPTGYV